MFNEGEYYKFLKSKNNNDCCIAHRNNQLNEYIPKSSPPNAKHSSSIF